MSDDRWIVSFIISHAYIMYYTPISDLIEGWLWAEIYAFFLVSGQTTLYAKISCIGISQT